MKKNCNKIASSAPQKSTLMAGQSKISSFFSSKRSQVIKTQDINSNGVKEFDIITIENSPQKQNFGKDHPDKSLSLNVSSRKNEPPASQSSSATISHADQSLKGSQRISPSLLRPCSSISKPSEDCDWNSESSDEIIGETPEKASIFNKLKMKSKIVHAENVNQKCRRSNNGPSKLSASNKSKLKSAIYAKQDSLMNADQSCIPPFDSREKTMPNKRLADQPTGLSPNSKKCDQILSREVNIKSCQSSLLSRLNDVSEMQKSVPPPQVSHKGQLSPYSINIAPAIKNKSSSILMDVDESLVDILNEYGYDSNKNLKATSQESPHSEDNSSSKKTLPKINQSRASEINCHNKIPNNSSPAQATDDAGNDMSKIPEENDDTVQEKSTNQDPIADFMDDSELEYEKLACEMEFMSPFKFSAKSCEEIPQSKFVGELLSEGIGADSYCSAGNFGRHVVTSVKHDLYEPILRLSLLQLSSNCPKTCSLHGSWSESVLQEDDIVHILFCSEVNGHYSVTDQEGIVIINPDVLLSGTSIVAGCFCRRKATLAETFKGIDGCNQVMLVGSLVHQLFQDVVEKKQAVSSSELQSLLQALLQQSWVVRDMYGLGLTPQILHAEMSKFLPHIEQFLRNYMPSAASLSLKNGCPAIKPRQSVGLTRGWSGTIKQVLDCEENFWSPRFGLKGKVDLTLAVQDHLGDRVLPLELKTGRATFSSEHRGQLMLYTLMMTDRRPLPSGSGLLLYLRSGDMEEVTTGHLEKRELLQLRNEMASYFARPPAVQKDGKLALPSLPSPIDRERACQGCPHLLVCTALNTAPPSPPHAMASLVPATLAHLQPNALEFFRHWCLLLHVESTQSKRALTRSLWCQDPIKRENSGGAVTFLKLKCSVEQGISQWLHSFSRACPSELPSNYSVPETIPPGTFQEGDLVVVSSKKCIAIAQGVIHSCDSTVVSVMLDRDLVKTLEHKRSEWYHVDACQYQAGMAYQFTGLAQLIQDTPPALKLRRLLIDLVPGVVKAGLSRSVVEQSRRILKTLNRDQQRAVLRCLMCSDYTIIRGYPGTGKSVSVVALVQVLVLMGKSVLLTAYTHSAVDNILLKLKAKGVDFLRLGRRSRIHPELHGYADEILTSSFTDVTQLADFYASKAVVATTCLAVNHVLFSKRRFDVCIVDEAAQVLLPACTAPLLCADKFVLVGDSQQLPPVVQSTQARSMGLTETVFSILERGGNQDCCSSLTLQYRMAAPIMRLANAITYNGQLQCASDALQDARLHLPYFQEIKVNGLPDWLRTAVRPEQSVLLLDTAGSACEQECSLGIQNTGELHITAAIVATLLQLGVFGVDIGVIAPYRAQVRLLQESLTQKTRDFITSGEIEIADQKNEDKNSGHLLASDEAGTSAGTLTYNEIKNSCRDGVDSIKRVDCKEPITTRKVLEESRKVEINTVDQYQGRDKLVIIYSCVRSCTDPKKAGELLRDERRLNVALTRAQRKLIVIGNVEALLMYEPLDKLVSVLGEEQIIKMDAEDGWQSCFSKPSS